MTDAPSGAPRRASTATAAGRADTRLVVIRGNSASGKSSVAQGLRDHYGRGVAIVGQDVIRRNVLREHDTARGANIALLGRIAREALEAGFHVVLEGILYADRYGHMITSLVRDHRGVSRCYYLDVPLEATLVRHASTGPDGAPDPGRTHRLAAARHGRRHRHRLLMRPAMAADAVGPGSSSPAARPSIARLPPPERSRRRSSAPKCAPPTGASTYKKRHPTCGHASLMPG
ncbi:hypothetical protein GCM10010149_59120 [Nonomuraea roseoviolacea subsp. roseoviolacea]|uniref:AAA family ATPase n=1 Tax=Nonomuraea roseoviolacea TaxID=103837 RepID=UPI0031CDB1AD